MKMRLVNKTTAWDMGNKRFEGKKKKFNVAVCYSMRSLYGEKDNPYWYYVVDRKEDDKRHNSLWTNERFNTKEECIEAAEKKIDELIKEK